MLRWMIRKKITTGRAVKIDPAMSGPQKVPRLVWFCSRGTIGSNRFGPDPIDTSEEDLVRTFE